LRRNNEKGKRSDRKISGEDARALSVGTNILQTSTPKEGREHRRSTKQLKKEGVNIKKQLIAKCTAANEWREEESDAYYC